MNKQLTIKERLAKLETKIYILSILILGHLGITSIPMVVALW